MTIKYFERCVCIFLFIAFRFTVQGSTPDTIRQTGIKKIDVVKQGTVFSTKEELSPKQAWLQLIAEKHHEQNTMVGVTYQVHWIAFTYQNETSFEEDKVLEIENPHIDLLNVYAIYSPGQPTLLAETGDRLLFSSRPIAHRNFAIPLSFQPGETKTILIKIDKRNTSLTFPTYLWNENIFYEKTYHENLWFGLYFGTIILCLCYALMSFVFLRKALYGWYFLFVFSSAWSISSYLGFSFQYFYPNILDINIHVRFYSHIGLAICLTKFSEQFFNFSEHLPKIKRVLNYILVLIIFHSFIAEMAWLYSAKSARWTIPIMYSIYFAGFIVLLYGVVLMFYKQRILVYIYLSAWLIQIWSLIIWIATAISIIELESFSASALLIGSSMEIFMLSIGLTYQMSKIYTERNALSASMAQVQKDLLKAYVTGVERERARISRDLHDDIGSRLGSLKRFLGGQTNVILEQQIDALYEKVRSLSHNLSSPSLKIGGLQQKLHELAFESQQKWAVKVGVQFFDFPQHLNDETVHHLFCLIQEAINNAVKHGSSSEIDVQIFCHQNELVITIDDNGDGFDTAQPLKGIGIKNMKARIEALNGIFEITSSVGKGTNILVKGVYV